MRFSKRLSFRGQMVLAVLLAATLPMLISMEITQRVASDKLYEQAFAALSAQRDLHRQKVEESLEEARTFVTSLSENLMVISALRSFTAEVGHLLEDLPPTTDELASMREELQVFYREKLGDNMGGSSAIPADPFGLLAQYHVLAKNPKPVGHKHETAEFNELGTYGAMHTQYHASLISIVNRYNYRDLFLIDKNGTVVYSAMKQRDYATNIISGAMRDTGLGRVAREALATTAPDKVFIDDFELYSGSGDTPAAFLSAPVVDGFNRKLGAVVIQLHADHFSRVLERGMSHRKTGDIVLVGSDAKLRSASHLDPQGGMLSTAAVGAALNEALAGKSGVIEIFDASGAEIHASYSPLDLPGLRWTIIASEAHSEAMGMIGYLRMLGWIMSAITVLIAIVVAVTQARSVKRQLGGEPGCLVQMAERMSAGDFVNAGRSDIATNSGAVRALTDMKTRLSQTIMNIRSAAGNVESGSREIANGNLNLSQRTEEQANHLQETASSMRRMTDSVKQNAANANQANSLASGARQTAERGVEVVQKTVAAMNAISESSRKITDITSVIDEIAFQTNLLALNAAVEAAHAGEQGRGFAVVANEVRNLAQRSAGAAREIKQLIEDSAGKVDAGTRLVNESGDSLQEIVASVRSVSDIVSGIANASQQQLAGIEQVGVSIHGMDEMTQQNAELVEQVAAASESMGVEAKKLSELITFFKLDAESKGAPRSAGTQHSMPRTSAAKGVAHLPKLQGERSAAYAGPERRAASRPWSNSSGAAPVLPKSKPVTRAKNANGTLDSSWTEF